MANLITIDQLLESVDLDFEPRFVTKDGNGTITVYLEKPIPERIECLWDNLTHEYKTLGPIKLAEFENKHWTECIYEVPRKVETTAKIEKIDGEFKAVEINGLNVFCITGEAFGRLTSKINELVDAANELKARMELPRLNPDLTDEDLRKMMRDPKYWRDKDSATIQKVQNGFDKLYGDNVLKAKGE